MPSPAEYAGENNVSKFALFTAQTDERWPPDFSTERENHTSSGKLPNPRCVTRAHVLFSKREISEKNECEGHVFPQRPELSRDLSEFGAENPASFSPSL